MMGRRVASLVAASGMAVGMLVLAVCLVVFPSSFTDKSEASAILKMVHAARPVHLASGGHRHSIGRTAPTALSEETETTDGLLANAGLLTALLLLSYVTTIQWGLSSAPSALAGPSLALSALCCLYSIVYFFQRRALCGLSGVFRL